MPAMIDSSTRRESTVRIKPVTAMTGTDVDPTARTRRGIVATGCRRGHQGDGDERQGDGREDRRQQPAPGWASRVSTGQGHRVLQEELLA